MYSVPIENNDTQVVYDFIYNQERQWNAPSYHQHHQRCMYYYTILFYDQCISQSPPQAADGVKLKERFSQHLQLGPYLDKVYASSEDIAAYPAWLADYMSSVIHENIDSYVVVKKEVIIFPDNVQLIGSDTLIHFKR